MRDIEKLIKQTILVNYGLKGKNIDRLAKILIRHILINEMDNYLDTDYINENLYDEHINGNEVCIDDKKAVDYPNLDGMEKYLNERYEKEFKLLDECLITN